MVACPNQIVIARRVFSPDMKEVLFAKRILEAMPDGAGVAMIDGKMQDDATWKQAKVIVDLARLVAKKDPELARLMASDDGARDEHQNEERQLLRGFPIGSGDRPCHAANGDRR